MNTEACSGSSGGGPLATGPDAPFTDPVGDEPIKPEEGDDGPHALGSVTLGEAHLSGASTARASVSIAFVPDAAAAKTCTRDVAGCALTLTPTCTTSCKGGEACVFDATCAPRCATIVDADKSESFDAGPVAISGATTPITLYPPYVYEGDAGGSPFLAGAELRVQAAGAASAGFVGFDEKLTATQFIQASPELAKIPRANVFGAGAMPISWVPGIDRIAITVAGEGGSLRCAAEDKTGRFEVPREVIKAALGGATNVSFTLTRERSEMRKDKKTKGSLAGATVQPVGWLSLATTSSESTSFQCSGAECTGPSSCQGCRTSKCRTEFDACTADATCPMLRTCLDDCPDTTCRNACFVKWPDPVAKAKNGALYKCQCVNACVAECTAECK